MDIRQGIKRATELYRENQYEESEKLLLALVKQAPEYANLHNMLGVIHSQHSQFSKAIYHFRKALSINPSYTEAQLNLAIILADTGAYEQAQSEFGKASEREIEFAFDLSSGMRTEVGQYPYGAGESLHGVGTAQGGHRRIPESDQTLPQLCRFP